MDLNRYRFTSVWRVGSPPDEVFRVLQDIGSYPRWWPEVRRVDRIDDRSVRIVVRSFLPYNLTFVATDSRQDESAGILETMMRGDLDGFSRWRIVVEGSGSRATFEEDVIARKKLLRRLALGARPFFRLNHTVMMRHGMRGLGVYLAGYRAGAESVEPSDARDAQTG
jgi:hypothetical protein